MAPQKKGTNNAHELFYTNFLNTPRGPGHPRKNTRTRFLPSKPKEDKLSRENTTFRPLSLRVEDPHPTWRSPDPKSESLCSFFWQAPKHTRKRHTPENAGPGPFPQSAISGVLRFWRPLRREQRTPENATHPKMQILGTVNYLRFRVCCVFGCSLFSSDFLPDNGK